MMDLSRERLLELKEARNKRSMSGELDALISMALRCLDMQEALSADRAEEIAEDMAGVGLDAFVSEPLRRYIKICREGK